MNKKIFPNFWQGLLIIALWATTNSILWTITTVMIINHNFSNLYQIIQVIILNLYFVPFIVYLIKKSNIKIGNYFSLPDLDTLFKLIIVSLLVRLIIVIPLDDPVVFFKSLMASKLKLYGIKYDNKIPDIVIALMWIFTPVAEEILYRGLILKQFLKQYPPTKAILLSSLIFSFAHLNHEDFAALFVMGIVLGIIYYKSNSILVSSISHYILFMGIILKFDILDLNPVNFTVYASIFLISILIVIFLLRKPVETIKISNPNRHHLE